MYVFNNMNGGATVQLTGDEIACAIDAYLVAHSTYVNGPRTITVNEQLCYIGHVYIDPSGFVVSDGARFGGGTNFEGNMRGENE